MKNTIRRERNKSVIKIEKLINEIAESMGVKAATQYDEEIRSITVLLFINDYMSTCPFLLEALNGNGVNLEVFFHAYIAAFKAVYEIECKDKEPEKKAYSRDF
jgi:hypothetical protein